MTSYFHHVVKEKMFLITKSRNGLGCISVAKHLAFEPLGYHPQYCREKNKRTLTLEGRGPCPPNGTSW